MGHLRETGNINHSNGVPGLWCDPVINIEDDHPTIDGHMCEEVDVQFGTASTCTELVWKCAVNIPIMTSIHFALLTGSGYDPLLKPHLSQSPLHLFHVENNIGVDVTQRLKVKAVL